MSSLAERLGSLTGLDTDTVQQQLLPSLDSMDVPSARSHLDSMLGPGAQQAALIKAYVSARTAPKASAPPSSATQGSRPASRQQQQQRPPSQQRTATPPSSSARASPVPPTAAPTPSAAATEAAAAAAAREVEDVPAELVSEVKMIDAELATLEPGSTARSNGCFCQARQHALCDLTPICRSCGLVLCSLNSPALACPSCEHTPLASPTALAARKNELRTRRSELIEKEKQRRANALEKLKRERDLLRFPELSGGGGYSSHASGASRDILARVDALASNAASQHAHAEAQQRVIRLDMKKGKGKGKATATIVKPRAAPAKAKDKKDKQPEDKLAGELARQEQADVEVGTRFVDPTDDGLRARQRQQSTADSASGQRQPPTELIAERPFVNWLVPAHERPTWTAPATTAAAAS